MTDANLLSKRTPEFTTASNLLMKYLLFAVFLVGVLWLPASAWAQGLEAEPEFAHKSPGKAAALSLLLPGLGHRYAHDGNWRGAASFFAVADVSFWLGLIGADWRHGQVVQSYRTLATTRADALLADKNRRFFLNLGLFRSSDEFLETQLRNRAWDQVDYVSDPAFQWQWASEEDFQEYRRLRDDADGWSRSRTLFISTLVANRLLAALTALRAARRANAATPDVSLSLAPPPLDAAIPVVNLSVRW